jgi:DNA-damage-inducible protein J
MRTQGKACTHKEVREMEMIKTATVAVRIDPELKNSAERIFKRLGISPSQAVNLFFAQVSLRGGLPFAVRVPNADTLAAMEESMKPEQLASYGSVADFMQEWGQGNVHKKNQGNVTLSKGHAQGAASGRKTRAGAARSRKSNRK